MGVCKFLLGALGVGSVIASQTLLPAKTEAEQCPCRDPEAVFGLLAAPWNMDANVHVIHETVGPKNKALN